MLIVGDTIAVLGEFSKDFISRSVLENRPNIGTLDRSGRMAHVWDLLRITDPLICMSSRGTLAFVGWEGICFLAVSLEAMDGVRELEFEGVGEELFFALRKAFLHFPLFFDFSRLWLPLLESVSERSEPVVSPSGSSEYPIFVWFLSEEEEEEEGGGGTDGDDVFSKLVVIPLEVFLAAQFPPVEFPIELALGVKRVSEGERGNGFLGWIIAWFVRDRVLIDEETTGA